MAKVKYSFNLKTNEPPEDISVIIHMIEKFKRYRRKNA